MRRAAEHLGRGPLPTRDYYPAYLYSPSTIYLSRDKKLVFEIALPGLVP